jgi:hypothetical protein
MTAMPRCNLCGLEVPAPDWNRPEPLPCSGCQAPVQVWVFPAGWTDVNGKPPAAIAAEGMATCFHHAENQAEAACGSCGRFVCSLCVDGSGEQAICSVCFERGTAAGEPRFQRRAPLYDAMGLLLAAVPLMTVLTGPIAGVFTLVTWKKTRTVVPRPGAIRWAALAISALWLAILAGMVALVVGALGRGR